MSRVRVYNEWDPLEEVIVGRAANARIAKPDRGLFAVEYAHCGQSDRIPSGAYPKRVIDETEEDLERLVEVLQQLGVVVRRPEIWDHAQSYRSPDWETDGQYNLCPRDLLVALDNWLIEAPMTLRCRQYETLSFKPLLLEYLRQGARWAAAPRPRLPDEAYCLDNHDTLPLTEQEPTFDAANILRIGRDILYQVSSTGNRLGAQWLQAMLGPEYRVRTCKGVYNGSHIDTTFAPIRPGLIVVSAERVRPDSLPTLFAGWDVVYFDDPVDIGFHGAAYASKWIAMNLLMVNPALAIVDRSQKSLIRQLEKLQVTVIPLQLRHARTLGGGFHCVTLDVRRNGTLQDYCDAPANAERLHA